MQRFSGIAASEGIAFGEAYILDRRSLAAHKVHLTPPQVPGEVARFRAAIERADLQLQDLMSQVADVGGKEHTLILEAHRLILKDEQLVDGTVALIADQQLNAEWALSRTVEGFKSAFDQVENEYFRERRSDVSFVASHLLHVLTGTRRDLGELSQTISEDAVIVAHDLSPAEAARLFRSRVKAFVTNVGGRTSHTAIVARSLGIPAVVGVKDATVLIGKGDDLIVDGYRGQVISRSDEPTRQLYQRRVRRRAQQARGLRTDGGLPAVTLDGAQVRLLANIELSDEIPGALAHGAVGIGLYRTEFLYLGRETPPSEADHLEDALNVLDLAGGRPVTFRTCDLRADKVPGAGGGPREANPALGLRSIRLCLEQPELFRPQLRGLLRAARHGQVRIMFPMIAGVEELRMARHMLRRCREDLLHEGEQVPEVPVGVMVEMPAAAVTADLLAQEADFFAIGTNDLTQYALAIDRGNPRVNHLFLPFHPALLRMIHRVVQEGERAGIPVSVCGEMAGDPLMTAVLLGMGVRDLSMNAPALPQVKRLLRGINMSFARDLARRVLGHVTPQDVEQELLHALEPFFTYLSLGDPSDWDEDTVA